MSEEKIIKSFEEADSDVFGDILYEGRKKKNATLEDVDLLIRMLQKEWSFRQSIAMEVRK